MQAGRGSTAPARFPDRSARQGRRCSEPNAGSRAWRCHSGLKGATFRNSSFQENLDAERKGWSGAPKAQGPNSTPLRELTVVQEAAAAEASFCSATYVCLCTRKGEGREMGTEFHFTALNFF